MPERGALVPSTLGRQSVGRALCKEPLILIQVQALRGRDFHSSPQLTYHDTAAKRFCCQDSFDGRFFLHLLTWHISIDDDVRFHGRFWGLSLHAADRFNQSTLTVSDVASRQFAALHIRSRRFETELARATNLRHRPRDYEVTLSARPAEPAISLSGISRRTKLRVCEVTHDVV